MRNVKLLISKYRNMSFFLDRIWGYIHLHSNKIILLSVLYLVIIFWECFLAELEDNYESRCQSTSTDEPKTKMNLFDNASNLLTNLLSGGSIGSMPIAEGAVSDLFDRPLFFSLYDWFIKVIAFSMMISLIPAFIWAKAHDFIVCFLISIYFSMVRGHRILFWMISSRVLGWCKAFISERKVSFDRKFEKIETWNIKEERRLIISIYVLCLRQQDYFDCYQLC